MVFVSLADRRETTRRLAPVLVVVALALSCTRPVSVAIDTEGATRLPFGGDIGVEGTLARVVRTPAGDVAADTAVVVAETYLVRRDGKAPNVYRINGRYDPARADARFALPEASVDVVYSVLVLPHRRPQALVPAEFFRPKTR
jgi:hypothetical protein